MSLSDRMDRLMALWFAYIHATPCYFSANWSTLHSKQILMLFIVSIVQIQILWLQYISFA